MIEKSYKQISEDYQKFLSMRLKSAFDSSSFNPNVEVRQFLNIIHLTKGS